MLKVLNSIIKDKGTMADLSQKVELFMNELTDDQYLELKKLCRDRSIGVILLPSDQLEEVSKLISEAIEAFPNQSKEEFFD